MNIKEYMQAVGRQARAASRRLAGATTAEKNAALFEKYKVFSRAETESRAYIYIEKYAKEIGLDVALEALKDARSQKKASADDLWRYAKICRVANVMRPYLEATE